VLLTTAVYALAVLASEKIPQGDGLGFDGVIYGGWVRSFPAPLLERSLDQYYIQRVFPAAAVHGALRLFRCALSNANIIRGFEGWAIGLVLMSSWIWTALAHRLSLSRAARWFGAVALFGSYATLKWTAYYPVLTDLWSVAFSLLQLLLFLDRRLLLLAAVTFVGAFTWPTQAAIGAILIAFAPPASGAPLQASPLPRGLRFIPAGLAASAWMLLCSSVIERGYTIDSGLAPLSRPLLRLSVLASAALLFGGVAVLADDRALLSRQLLRRYVLRPHLLLAAAVLVGVKLLQLRLARATTPHPLTELLNMTAYTALQKPAVFVVAHTAFFGPLFLVMVLRWRGLVALLRSYGPALVVTALLGLALFLNSESRHLWNIVALFIPFAVKLLDELSLTRKRFAQLAAWTLVSSNVWLTYEGPVWPGALQFPGQLFFMTNGPWMSFTMYAVQGAVVVSIGLWLTRWLPRVEERAPERATFAAPRAVAVDPRRSAPDP
jgi:hypothetical protein